MKPTLEDAITLATVAHRGQVDKAGAPYILHPLRVMLAVKDSGRSFVPQDITEARMVAVLHDVVEDSSLTLDALFELGYPPLVVSAVKYLTRPVGMSYDEYIERLCKVGPPMAMRVKLLDLEDNLDLSRIAYPTEQDIRRTVKYTDAWHHVRAGLMSFVGL